MSLTWHDFGECSELVSSHLEHGNKLSMWQIDDTPTATTPYKLTKTRDFYRERPEGIVLTQAISPCGTSIATLSTNEQIAVWKLFERRQADLSSCDPDFNEQAAGEAKISDDILRLKLERLDASLVAKGMMA